MYTYLDISAYCKTTSFFSRVRDKILVKNNPTIVTQHRGWLNGFLLIAGQSHVYAIFDSFHSLAEHAVIHKFEKSFSNSLVVFVLSWVFRSMYIFSQVRSSNINSL